ncbi:hypothetical protein CBR_g312 [Chara braunii]|uniref:Uncharacterized protein n=1 Tax=Chara braunii TaxID=69332 RepID=A0A388JQJ9_CHABU|nr:hypothetical protein CBR_g312 [Chara braunii]|eukprot:GBG59982.1 hypothetical protein CBR_g312 [Chara braunii]
MTVYFMQLDLADARCGWFLEDRDDKSAINDRGAGLPRALRPRVVKRYAMIMMLFGASQESWRLYDMPSFQAVPRHERLRREGDGGVRAMFGWAGSAKEKLVGKPTLLTRAAPCDLVWLRHTASTDGEW